MKNAYGLYRCSTQLQADRGNSVHAQRDSVRAFAKANGLNLVAEFTDAGVSGGAALEKRQGLVTALAELQKGDVLLVAKYDRLARDLMLQLTIEKAVSRKGATIIAVSNEGAAGNGPSDVLLRRLLTSVAEYEKAIIQERCKASAQARKRRGLVAGHPVYGYTAGPDGELVECTDELSVIARTIQLRKTRPKKTSWRQVALILNNEGYTNRAGNPWKLHNVRAVLKDRI